jgi:hypothetical protein
MTKKQEKQDERDAAIKQLRKEIRPGTTLYTILRHCSRSGMQRSISVVLPSKNGPTLNLDWFISKALDMKMDQTNGGLKISGCGMDMGFALVYELSAALWGYGNKRGYGCLGDHCPSNSHSNDRNAPRGKGIRHRDGYAISQRWL